ncbi:transposase family protein [Candidatus Enterovibrio escicola]|uniref:Mobile element protein n=1 Tax=Candidatus Enterovibrio escicola TaxID=1927127 RepID=A0A2A5SZP4_9GAMM|nr:transposase family protein [Candidatus Enterovibrio escacola]PCS21366.1 Mobile element protein [Candidatus Enterovibrio escacola]
MTKQLIEYIERESQKRTFLSIADDIGVDEKTIRNIFQDYCEREEE